MNLSNGVLVPYLLRFLKYYLFPGMIISVSPVTFFVADRWRRVHPTYDRKQLRPSHAVSREG